jgi:hypothetical protein
VLFRIWAGFLASITLLAVPTAANTPPLTDEALRAPALHAIFPGMAISRIPGKRIDDSWVLKPLDKTGFDLPDAMADQPVYRVEGKPANRAEDCAASDVIETDRIGRTRLLRFQLFPAPGTSGTSLVAILQYRFSDANPPMSCPTLGIIVRLRQTSSGWQATHRHLLETTHHSSIQRVELLNLTADSSDELVVESNYGGAGAMYSSFQVFDIANGGLQEILTTDSRSSDASGAFTQLLSLPKTLQSHGRQFCFTQTVLAENLEPLRQPRVAHPCWPRGAGVDNIWSKRRNSELLPHPQTTAR